MIADLVLVMAGAQPGAVVMGGNVVVGKAAATAGTATGRNGVSH